MAMLFFDPTGANGENLATEAAGRIGAAAGVDPEFGSITIDDDSASEEELQAKLFAALDELDPDWRSQLAPAD
jgi:hypothetical protein